jgi:hypothetical protein
MPIFSYKILNKKNEKDSIEISGFWEPENSQLTIKTMGFIKIKKELHESSS